MRRLPMDVDHAAELVCGASRPVVFTGAGMSKESGMRTFRGPEGFWRRYRAEELASIDGIRKNPALAWKWYGERFRILDDLEPHAGYRALFRLQEWKGNLFVVTQNVDGLHRKAGLRNVVELHGSLRTASCLEKCGAARIPMDDDLFSRVPPRCVCGSVLRPDVVLFGENLPERELKKAFELAENCDLMLVVGTSMVVYPAAFLPYAALSAGIPVVEVNPERTPLSDMQGVIRLAGEAGEVLPQLVEEAMG